MKNTIKVLGLQHDIVWKNISANLSSIESILGNKYTDIFILPEMFATGFCMDVKEIADSNHHILKWMVDFAKKKNSAVAGSVAAKEGNQYFNRFYFVEKNGTVHQYDKRHLFSYAGEDRHYSPGTQKVVFDYLGWKICLQVCYDLRFPVFFRNTEHYDLLLNVASWPASRMGAWNTLLQARAIENQAYVFGLNRLGEDGNQLGYTGESHCFFPDGADVSHTTGSLVEAVLYKEKLDTFRRDFPFLNDQDLFKII